ncbi:5'-3' exonuclease [Bacillus ectoiniformans]|uniref:5'-3' exonuclease n=1 Tax=Bacillus ectoiniformans TaxID=1494429 RepID=UPI001957B603|nr:5'-3' exonuclease [Bacillus ectoiniformans]MBM7647930.1 5'-3' exonuclease [Bacillus ectoiniformans]
MENREHVLLVDGMALLFRAFFATSISGQFMMNSKGLPTNGVQGFMKHLLLAVENKRPTHVAVCWDMGSQTFRNELYDLYKSNRNAPPIELIPQFDLAKEVASAFALPNIGVAGYEADDCIGTIAKKEQRQRKVTILSGDKDLLQLLDDQIEVMLLQKGFGNYLTHSTQSFYEQYQITPEQFIDVKALMGDPSDGYPGVKGIGEKTAFKLVQQFETIDGILENLASLSPAQRRKIEENLDMLHLSRRLAEVNCSVPLDWKVEESIWEGISPQAEEAVEELELKVLRKYLIGAKMALNQSEIGSPFL